MSYKECLCVTMAIACLCLPSARCGEIQGNPFDISVQTRPGATQSVVQVDFQVAPNCTLYADRLHFVTAEDTELVPLRIAQPVTEWDKVQQRNRSVYEHSFSATLDASQLISNRLLIKFQGCTNGACFAPEKRQYALEPDGTFARIHDEDETIAASAPAVADLKAELQNFKVLGRRTGFMKSAEFIAFVDRAISGHGEPEDPVARFKQLGLSATILLILLGGLLLNLTPCVLPMIPINLAIIGAGSRAQTRTSGFKNGGLYGLGMALAYGVVGLGVVLTGAKFGALNSTAWFNVLIALIFLLMALGMFDVLNLDFSRFSARLAPRHHSGSGSSRLHDLLVFGMGAVAAVLAGACVAPVVVSVMLLSANLYAKGLVAGLLLPFLLGIGMALPWPFAGAGLAILPKPGRWMKRIKYAFGVIILLFSAYYGHLGYIAYTNHLPATAIVAKATEATASSSTDGPNQELLRALLQAQTDHKPLFVDFHASWCKNCLAMDATVFNQAQVITRLKDFIVLRYAAEKPNEPPAKAVLDHFGIMGLPSYLILTAKEASASIHTQPNQNDPNEK